MSPSQEKKFLFSVASRLDRSSRNLAAMRTRLILSWFVLVVVLVLAFSVAPLLPPMAAAIMFIGLGAAGTYVYFRIVAARGWVVLQRFLDRAAIEARLSELGA